LKKLAAILLLSLFLFNLFGYRVWFYYEQQKADKQLEASLDNEQYDDADLITIKIPISLGYQPEFSSFTRVDGEVNLDGKIYKYVKRGIVNGELVLLCLPDHNKMRLQTAKDDIFKYSNDLQQNSSSKKSGNNTIVFKSVISDFDKQTEAFTIAEVTIKKNKYFSPQAPLLLTDFHDSPEQPPEVPTVAA
jgi:hypothetical protein